MCLYPKILPNPKYQPNEKNGGYVPIMKDPRVGGVPVGCGKCMECMKKKARDWKIRLLEEVRHERHGAEFITLTFAPEEKKKLIADVLEENPNCEGYDLDNAVAKLAFKRFNDRWKKKHKTRLKHWIVTELGDGRTEHLHIHGIVWNKVEPSTRLAKNNRIRYEFQDDIKKLWKYGNTYCGDYVNEATVGYIVKYLMKQDEAHPHYKPITLATNGLGANYIKSHNARLHKFNKNGETREVYITREGYKIQLPMYYRYKLYSEEEREDLWLQKLDKGERWVDGSKVNVLSNEPEYYNLLKKLS